MSQILKHSGQQNDRKEHHADIYPIKLNSEEMQTKTTTKLALFLLRVYVKQ